MLKTRDFAADLARDGKTAKEIKGSVQRVYGSKAILLDTIYHIINKIKTGKMMDDQRHFSSKKTKRSAATIAGVTAAVTEDTRCTIAELARDIGVSRGTVHTVVHDDLALVMKLACWASKLLLEGQKKEKMRMCKKIVADVYQDSLAYLDKVVTVDETMVSLHT